MYERGHKIEARLHSILILIRSGKHSTSDLSDKLNISTATVSRSIEALRLRGYEIQAVRDKETWHYELKASEDQLEIAFDEASNGR